MQPSAFLARIFVFLPIVFSYIYFINSSLNIKYAFNHISAVPAAVVVVVVVLLLSMLLSLLPQQIIPHETKVNHLEIYGPANQNDERTNARLCHSRRAGGRGERGGWGGEGVEWVSVGQAD